MKKFRLMVLSPPDNDYEGYIIIQYHLFGIKWITIKQYNFEDYHEYNRAKIIANSVFYQLNINKV